jgi:hypothetical protein
MIYLFLLAVCIIVFLGWVNHQGGEVNRKLLKSLERLCAELLSGRAYCLEREISVDGEIGTYQALLKWDEPYYCFTLKKYGNEVLTVRERSF